MKVYNCGGGEKVAGWYQWCFVLCMPKFSYHLFVKHFHIKLRGLNQFCDGGYLDKSDSFTVLTFEWHWFMRKEGVFMNLLIKKQNLESQQDGQ